MIVKWLPVIQFLCIPMIYEESQFTNDCPCQMKGESQVNFHFWRRRLKSVTGFVIYTPAAWLSWWCLQSSSEKQDDKSITSIKTLLLVNSLKIPRLLRVCVCVCVWVGGWVRAYVRACARTRETHTHTHTHTQ